MFQNILRISVGIFSLLLIGWLAVSYLTPASNPKHRVSSDDRVRLQLLNALIKDRHLNALTIDERDHLFRMLKMITGAAELQDSIRLDVPLEPKKSLTFLVTDSRYEKLTNCTRSNAVYDGVLNVVFIDQLLIKQDEWQHWIPAIEHVFTKKDMPYLDTYLALVIAHELGHHRQQYISKKFSLSDFFIRKSARQEELDADTFAVQTMIRGVAKYSNFLPKGAGKTVILVNPDTLRSPADKAALAITEMGLEMQAVLLMGPEAYSPFQHDDAHPTFFQRSANFVRAATQLKCRNADIQASAQYADDMLTRMSEITGRCRFTEISLPKQITDMTFTNEGLLILAPEKKDNDRPWFVSYTQMQNNEPSGQLKKVTPVKRDLHYRSKAIEDDGMGVTYGLAYGKIWSFNSGVLVVAGFDDIHASRPPFNHWKSLPIPDLQDHPDNRIIAQRQPFKFIYETGANSEGALPDCITEDMHSHLLPREAINAFLKRQLPRSEITYNTDELELLDNIAFLPIYQKGRGVLGIIRVHLPDYKLEKLNLLNTTNFRIDSLHGGQGDGQEMRILPTDDGRFFLIRKITGEDHFELYQLYEKSRPVLIKQTDFLFRKFSRSLRSAQGEAYLSNEALTYIGHNNYTLNWGLEFLYQIDLDHPSVKPLFFPGNGDLQVRPSSKGYVALYPTMMNKLYLFRP